MANMATELPTQFDPQEAQQRWLTFWDERGYFHSRPDPDRTPYTIVIPPPNVTGVLTMGHVLNNTIQDILARKARMDGKEVLWLPGTDHAGIATQNVVEKTMKKAGEIKHRNDLGREALVAKIWEWKEKYGGIILQQLRALGCSCDWTRTRFTMDPEYSRCVAKVFVDLYKKGLIYRGKRMVNWCPASLTALSDEEVVMKEQKGSLYYFKVEVAEQPGTFLTIATTRPETIPGDTAVAVNPKDPRYSHLIGKHVVRPLPAEFSPQQKLIPIIGDQQVDFEFGTGVLKVTPAHDKADFEIGLRHKLAVVEVIQADGTMNDLAGADLKGLDRFKARKLAVEKLTELGALEKEEPYTNNVGFSERADVPVEPRLSEQWFLKYPSTEASRAVVAEGRMKFFPDRWAKVYDHWMGGIQDWCISRQLWWGHRIPVWTLPLHSCGDEVATELKEYFGEWGIQEASVWIEVQQTTPNCGDVIRFLVSGDTADLAAVKLNSFYQHGKFDSALQDGFPTSRAKALAETIMSRAAAGQAEQDPDVLDTWCSSWLWPFATMGWTGDKVIDEKNATLKTFYPTTDLVTGPDIIFFWVARMIMAGYEYMGEMPFRNVYFTGIIRDKQGRKMSKSLGNSPDPLDLIAKYGADALRFGVMRAAPLGQDILFDEQNVELGRNFCNKLWNACRFRQMQGGEVQGEIDPVRLTSDDKWILLRLDQAIREITAAFSEYRFNEATTALYRFFWSEYCDWYVEATKAVLHGSDAQLKANTLAVIDFVLSHTLRLFHPFLPFITEDLWHGLAYHTDMPADQGGTTIMFARWPRPLDDRFKDHYGLDESDERFANAKYELVTQARNLRREANIPSSKRVKFVFRPANALPVHEVEVLKILLNAESLDITPENRPKKGTPTVHSVLGELYLPLEGLIDVDSEKARLTKELVKIDAEIEKVRQKLNNPAFAQKVPPAVLEEHQKRLLDWQSKRHHVQNTLEALS
jgi:valyl-tRNA synthetase